MVEKLGGRKFLLALVIVLVILAVLVISAVSQKLDTGLAGVLVGAVTWVATQFGLTNMSITKASLNGGSHGTSVSPSPADSASTREAIDGAVESVRGATDNLRADGERGATEAERRVADAAQRGREALYTAARTGGTDIDG